MRQLLIALASLLVGALLAFSAANSLQRRDAWPRGVMYVMQHHFGELRRLQRAQYCAPAGSGSHFLRLAQTGADISPSNAEEKPDFHERAERFVALGAGLAAQPPADCPALDRALQQVDAACADCHRDYR